MSLSISSSDNGSTSVLVAAPVIVDGLGVLAFGVRVGDEKPFELLNVGIGRLLGGRGDDIATDMVVDD